MFEKIVQHVAGELSATNSDYALLTKLNDTSAEALVVYTNVFIISGIIIVYNGLTPDCLLGVTLIFTHVSYGAMTASATELNSEMSALSEKCECRTTRSTSAVPVPASAQEPPGAWLRAVAKSASRSHRELLAPQPPWASCPALAIVKLG